MKIFGINYAPFLIPLERRKQTFSVFVWIGSFFFIGPLITVSLAYMLFFTRFYFIPLLYLAWYVADRNTQESGGRRYVDTINILWCNRIKKILFRWLWVREWRLWKWYAQYFPVKLVKEAELDPKYNYILGSHPHGILCSGAFCNFATEGTNVAKVYPGLTFFLTTLNLQFVMPFYREFFMTGGAVSASRKSIDYVLNSKPSGNVVVLVVSIDVNS